MLKPEDFKEVKCPFHGDEMQLIQAVTDWEPSMGNVIKGEYRGRCGCKFTFNTGGYWVMKPTIEKIEVPGGG